MRAVNDGNRQPTEEAKLYVGFDLNWLYLFRWIYVLPSIKWLTAHLFDQQGQANQQQRERGDQIVAAGAAECPNALR